MREILFRGQTRRFGEKVKMNGEKLPGNWVYGGIFPGTGDFSIIYGSTTDQADGEKLNKHVVYSDTVGQYTGLTDKNGVKIFEGDCIHDHLHDLVGVIRYGEYCQPFDDYKFSGHIGFYVDWVFGSVKDRLQKDLGYWHNRVYIIANIHDNPELFKEGTT